MNEGDVVRRYGLPPNESDLVAIRDLLVRETAREVARYTDPENDDEDYTSELKECAVLLFAAAHVEDSLLIWRAKRSSADNGFSVDVQLLCGAGLAVTLAYLKALATDEARAAHAYIVSCEHANDFEGGDDPGGRLSDVVPSYRRYYRL